MKNFFYNRYNSCFSFMTNHWHFKNLSTNGNCLDFRALPKKVFIDHDFSGVRLLANPHATGFDGFFFNRKLLREQSELDVVRWID